MSNWLAICCGITNAAAGLCWFEIVVLPTTTTTMLWLSDSHLCVSDGFFRDDPRGDQTVDFLDQSGSFSQQVSWRNSSKHQESEGPSRSGSVQNQIDWDHSDRLWKSFVAEDSFAGQRPIGWCHSEKYWKALYSWTCAALQELIHRYHSKDYWKSVFTASIDGVQKRPVFC